MPGGAVRSQLDWPCKGRGKLRGSQSPVNPNTIFNFRGGPWRSCRQGGFRTKNGAIGPRSERQALIRRKASCFKDVPQPILERLATLSVTKHLDRRETLFNRGDGWRRALRCRGRTGPYLGRQRQRQGADLFQMTGAGRRVRRDRLAGWAAAHRQCHGAGSDRAAGDQRSAFLSVLENEPTLARHIIELLCERMRLKTDLLSDFAFADCPSAWRASWSTL